MVKCICLKLCCEFVGGFNLSKQQLVIIIYEDIEVKINAPLYKYIHFPPQRLGDLFAMILMPKTVVIDLRKTFVVCLTLGFDCG